MSKGIRVRGRKNQPSYDFEGEGLQPTLDGFRAYSIFNQITPEIDELITGDIDSALMYGSNINGLSAFSDCEAYDWESDMDLLYAVKTEDIDTVRSEIERYLDQLDFPVETHIDVRDADEISDTLESIADATSPLEIMDEEFKISYPAFYFQKSAPKRMRAFATGFIPHQEFDGGVISDIEEALENFVNHLEKPEVLDKFQEGSRNYSNRKDEMRKF